MLLCRLCHHVDNVMEDIYVNALQRQMLGGMYGQGINLVNQLIAEDAISVDEQKQKAVWFSPLGGVNEQKAKERKLRSDGKAISRSFNIAPGSKADFVVTVTQGAGKSQPNGIITPEGKPEVIIRVACSSENLKGLIFLVFRATIGIVHSDDSFRIGERKLNSTTESSLWTIFLLLQPHFTMRQKYLTKRKRYDILYLLG